MRRAQDKLVLYSILVTIFLQLIASAFWAGELRREVVDLSNRVTRIETLLDNHFKSDPPAARR